MSAASRHHAPDALGIDGLRPVSARYVPARYVAGIPGYVFAVLLVVAASGFAVWTERWWIALFALIPLLLALQGLLLTPRRVRAIGYRDGEDEITVASGVMFRQVTITPYGRIQSVEVNEGPVARRFGLASLSYSTASTHADGSVPGLPRAEAERLRDLLTRRGVERMQSL